METVVNNGQPYSWTTTVDQPKKLRLKKIKLDPNDTEQDDNFMTISNNNQLTPSDLLTLILRNSSTTSFPAHQILPLFNEALETDDSTTLIGNLMKTLLSLANEEKDELVKTSLITVIKDILRINGIERHYNFSFIVEDLLALIASTRVKLIIAEILNTIEKIIIKCPIVTNHELNQNLISATKHLLLNNCSHIVKRQCLILLAFLAPVDFGGGGDNECSSIIKLLREYSHYHDPRVRSSALASIIRLNERGVKLDISLYSEFCEALKDDYEGCRISTIKLIQILSKNYGDCLVSVNQGEEQIRLVDDAFAKICSIINDSSIKVRTEAASLLGSFTNVSIDFLEQTLDKKLMSNLRRKKSAHERNRESYAAGEWSSGKKWADDAPHENICPEAINLMDIGACGAFIHGLEDEFLEVRSATLDSITALAMQFPSFAHLSMDFIVDMFNDEIEDIRLKAIFCLGRIAQQSICLRDDQIDIILCVLEDSSIDIREALHEVLANCRIATEGGLKSSIYALLDNLRRYPEDRISIWKCLQKLGLNHASLTKPIVADLLMIHNYLDLPEPSLDDHAYISGLILVFNAASQCPSIMDIFLDYTKKHYAYLRDSQPNLVPHILSLSADIDSDLIGLNRSTNGDAVNRSAQKFLANLFKRIKNIMIQENVNLMNQTDVIKLSINDLERFGTIERSMSNACDFLKQYFECQISLRKIMANHNWINAFLLSPLQSSIFRSSLQQILQTTFRLIHQFHGLHPLHLSLIYQTRVKALALQLVAVINGSNASALTLCEAFLEEVKMLKEHLKENDLEADSLTQEMINEIDKLTAPKPGSVARALQPLFLLSSKLLMQSTDLTRLVSDKTLASLSALGKCTAVINEPTGRSETPLKFTAGLILTIKLDATISNVKDLRTIRLKIHSPDQQTNLVSPRLSDFRPLDVNKNGEVISYRLLTNVYVSHGVWTEACHIAISIIADFREISSTIGISQTWASKTGTGLRTKPEDSLTIELCKPVKLLIAPKQHKKGF